MKFTVSVHFIILPLLHIMDDVNWGITANSLVFHLIYPCQTFSSPNIDYCPKNCILDGLYRKYLHFNNHASDPP